MIFTRARSSLSRIPDTANSPSRHDLDQDRLSIPRDCPKLACPGSSTATRGGSRLHSTIVEAIEQDPGRPSVEPSKLRELMARRDEPGLVLVAAQGVLLVEGLVVAALYAGQPIGWLAVAIASLALLGAFPAMHEAGHSTAFAKPIFNEIVVTVGAFLMLQAPTFFREFHWQHHRKTQDPKHDPEIAGAPAILDGWPTNPFTYLALVSGQMLLIGKAGFTIACALMPNAAAWNKAFPFIRESKRSRIAWESRATVIAWALVLFLGYSYVDGF